MYLKGELENINDFAGLAIYRIKERVIKLAFLETGSARANVAFCVDPIRGKFAAADAGSGALHQSRHSLIHHAQP
jgi:hypothetical protein